MDLNIYAEDKEQVVDLSLMKDGKPTCTFIGLVALELCLDALIAYGAYRLFKRLGK